MKMKKFLKIYLLLWVGVIVSSVLLIVAFRSSLFSPHHRLAQDPTNIEKITKFDLPDIASVESWNNLERGTSRWDLFGHVSVFAEELSDECIQQLEIKCQTDTIYWHKDKRTGCYEYLDDAWNRGGIYCICCHIYKDHSNVEYYVVEEEGVEDFVLSFLSIFLVVIILLVWGIILLIRTIVRKCKKQKMHNDKSAGY